jgi:CheY-like chemotaxis protein
MVRPVMRISELLGLLRPIEEEALAAYSELSVHCAGNPGLAAFLKQLARDEAAHVQLLERAGELLRQSGQDPVASIEVDASTPHRVAAPLRELLRAARAGALTERDALTAIMAAEFSEWNGVFLYAVGQFRQSGSSLQHIAALLQQHLRHITDYIATRPVEVRPPETTPALPQVWSQRLLVVDDEEPLRMLMQDFLGEFGTVTVAANGAEAVALTRGQFYDVIITDLDMPVMDGQAFYEAVAADAAVRQRFIFVTGQPRPAVKEICDRHRLPLLVKPFRLDALRQAVVSVLNRDDSRATG